MNFKKIDIFLFMLVISFLFSSILTLAQINYPEFPFRTWFSVDALAKFLGVPADWLVIPRVIYYVIVPFLVAVTVTYGILTELNIFRSYRGNKINIILSVAMSFLLLPSGILSLVVSYFYAFNTFVGLIGFGILFFVGTVLWVYGRARTMRHEFGFQADVARGMRSKLSGLDKEIAQLRRQIVEKKRESDYAAADKLETQLIAKMKEQAEEADRLKKILQTP
jgi:hypothetical protein